MANSLLNWFKPKAATGRDEHNSSRRSVDEPRDADGVRRSSLLTHKQMADLEQRDGKRVQEPSEDRISSNTIQPKPAPPGSTSASPKRKTTKSSRPLVEAGREPRNYASSSRLRIEDFDNSLRHFSPELPLPRRVSPELQAPRQISPELPVVVSPRKTHVTTVKSGTRVAHADPQPAAQMPRNPTPIPWETAYTLYHSLDQFRAPAGTDKPPFPYWVILRAAILGSPDKQLSLTDLTSQIMEKFPHFKQLPASTNQFRFKGALADRFCFECKGSLWTVDETVDPAESKATRRKMKAAEEQKREMANDPLIQLLDQPALPRSADPLFATSLSHLPDCSIDRPPPFPLWTLARAALLGSPKRMLTCFDISKAIMTKYPGCATGSTPLTSGTLNVLESRACFYQVQVKGGNVRVWTVDLDIDPRLKRTARLPKSNLLPDPAPTVDNTTLPAFDIDLDLDAIAAECAVQMAYLQEEQQRFDKRQIILPTISKPAQPRSSQAPLSENVPPPALVSVAEPASDTAKVHAMPPARAIHHKEASKPMKTKDRPDPPASLTGPDAKAVPRSIPTIASNLKPASSSAIPNNPRPPIMPRVPSPVLEEPPPRPSPKKVSSPLKPAWSVDRWKQKRKSSPSLVEPNAHLRSLKIWDDPKSNMSSVSRVQADDTVPMHKGPKIRKIEREPLSPVSLDEAKPVKPVYASKVKSSSNKGGYHLGTNNVIVLDDSSEDESDDMGAASIVQPRRAERVWKPQVSERAQYTCGVSDPRKGTNCEVRFNTQLERTDHLSQAHGIVAAGPAAKRTIPQTKAAGSQSSPKISKRDVPSGKPKQPTKRDDEESRRRVSIEL